MNTFIADTSKGASFMPLKRLTRTDRSCLFILLNRLNTLMGRGREASGEPINDPIRLAFFLEVVQVGWHGMQRTSEFDFSAKSVLAVFEGGIPKGRGIWSE
jgi:hypothetical protein